MSLKQNHGQPINFESANITEELRGHLKEVFPDLFLESNKVDWNKLRLTLGDTIDDSPERYSFTWAGKKDAIRLLQTPTRATLIPDQKESVNFNKTDNIFIEGDNLEVMKLLYKSYFGRIKMIYIDPPYNTGQDFIYPDNFADSLDSYLKITGQRDAEGNLLTSNPESSGRYHSDWISMMYPRLFVARQLLSENGIIFVSIDDIELYNLRILMNEIFGEENFVDCIIWKKRYGGGAKERHLVTLHEYIVFYAKNKEAIGEIYVPLDEKSIKRYYKGKDENHDLRGPYRTHPLEATKSVEVRKNLIYAILSPDGEEIWPERQWWWEESRAMQALEKNELEFIKGKNGKVTVHTKQYLKDENGIMRKTKPFSIVDNVFTQHGTAEIAELFGDSRVFPFPKPSKLIYFLLELANLSSNDIVLDFFAGSCATADAIMQLNDLEGINCNFIMVQLPEPTPEESYPRENGYETIADIGKERIRRVIKKIKKKKKGKEKFGLKVFKLSESNFKHWKGVKESDTEEYIEQMKMFVDPLKSKWNEQDVIYEVAIKEGFSLNIEINKVAKVKNQKIYDITDADKDQFFYICLDKSIKLENLSPLELTQEHLFICRDIALNDDVAANLALQCRLKTI